ncbi:MAG TPA: class I SAM-dependent methyltransferase [Kofleriaceae bacterium]|nr:class I SAM-dependent methyltransferase [Kofleriaceae bacterium]
MDEVQHRIVALRAELREQTSQARRTLADAYKLSGDVFVDEVGTIVRVVNGEGEFFYTPDAARMRGPMLEQLAESRKDLYGRIGSQFRPNSRVLVIGSGSDVDAIRSLAACGHDVIATDFAEVVVDALRHRVDVPAFACDLLYLDRILPEPVDYIVGNSVLGYLDPAKCRRIVSNLWTASTAGGVFTFDQTPHPGYFEIAEQHEEQLLVNPSAADPRKLTEYVKRLGPAKGIAAMAVYAFNRSRAINFATISIVSEMFRGHGARTSTGEYELVTKTGAINPDPILRIARSHDALLEPVEGEERFETVEAALRARRDEKPWLALVYVDRGAAEPLARALGIHTTAREDAWGVMHYVAEHPPTNDDIAAVRDSVLAELDPVRAATRIIAAIDGAGYVPPRPMRKAVAADQTIHKGVAVGDIPADQEQADLGIDRAYAAERQQAVHQSQRVNTERSARDRREQRKRQKRDRKRQRGR